MKTDQHVVFCMTMGTLSYMMTVTKLSGQVYQIHWASVKVLVLVLHHAPLDWSVTKQNKTHFKIALDIYLRAQTYNLSFLAMSLQVFPATRRHSAMSLQVFPAMSLRVFPAMNLQHYHHSAMSLQPAMSLQHYQVEHQVQV